MTRLLMPRSWRHRAAARRLFTYVPAHVRTAGPAARLAWWAGASYADCDRIAGWGL